jgi:transcriptional regulator
VTRLPQRHEVVPALRSETVRQQLRELLGGEPRSALELSGLVGIPEKEVAGHLAHLRLSLHRTGGELHVVPARCLGCGFVFSKRERLTRPGKCPVCRHGQISDPLFAIIDQVSPR